MMSQDKEQIIMSYDLRELAAAAKHMQLAQYKTGAGDAQRALRDVIQDEIHVDDTREPYL
jgi:hypothetical protein